MLQQRVSQTRREWLDGLRVGDEVMQVHDRGHWEPSRWRVIAVTDDLIVVQRKTCKLKYFRSDGVSAGGSGVWRIEPVTADGVSEKGHSDG